MPLPRSFLYVPANREKFLDKAVGLPADAFIFDLEDSVPPAEKARARAAIRDYAPKIPDQRVWVRPNALDTEFGHGDLDAVIGIAGIAGLFVPKVESCDDVRRHQARAVDRERARRAQRVRHGDCGETRGVADVRRRPGRRSQHRSWLRLVDRWAGNAACAQPY